MIFIEAENFDHLGGWVVDQQFMNQMGSPFLMAHGLGNPVADASTRFEVERTGIYHVWARTRDWAAPWKKPEQIATGKEEDCPGRFQVIINGEALQTVFGTEGAAWHWQYGGEIHLPTGINHMALHDLTGFNGRCDAIFLSTERNVQLPDGGPELLAFRRKLTGNDGVPRLAGQFDLVVAGGGIAGICAAVSAARLGLRVALIHNRPVVGGNNSSEVRVQLGGKVNLPPYPQIGNIVNELDARQGQNARPGEEYKDYLKMGLVENQPGLSLFLNTQVVDCEVVSGEIKQVETQHVLTGERLVFQSNLFADCTGDANLGYLAGANYRMGRESRAETGESIAPEEADMMTMGSSVMWYSVEKEDETFTFPETSWAIQFDDLTCQKARKGDWDWETGLGRDQIEEFEFIRDYGLRAVFGNWSYLKNKSKLKDDFKNRQLEWVAYIAGKRESRRLMGDVVLQQQDIDNRTHFPDAAVTTTWSIDLHHPKIIPNFQEEPFRARCVKTKIEPYAIPYRSLYSRNIANLFMAGRNISVTHVALGTVRVMRTTGMMGEVVGMAASVCIKNKATPREVYEKHLEELIDLFKKGVPSMYSEISESTKTI